MDTNRQKNNSQTQDLTNRSQNKHIWLNSPTIGIQNAQTMKYGELWRRLYEDSRYTSTRDFCIILYTNNINVIMLTTVDGLWYSPFYYWILYILSTRQIQIKSVHIIVLNLLFITLQFDQKPNFALVLLLFCCQMWNYCDHMYNNNSWFAFRTNNDNTK